MIRILKPKKCKVCRKTFDPFRPLQVCCSHGCAIEYAQKNRINSEKVAQKAQKQELKVQKERIKTRGDWTKEAQTEFNKFIRARDRELPCVSCLRHHAGQYHAGHYRTIGANPELRFEERNVWKQCAPCNNHLHGNLINYRIELIRRIGMEQVEWLEGNHEPKHYSIEELKAIKAKYSKLARELLKGLER